MGAFKEPHGGELKELYLTETAADRKSGPRLQVLGPHAAAALRPRAADERRILAAGRLHERGDYDGVRDMRLTAACSGRCRSRSTSPKRSRRARQEGERIALRDPEGVLLATMESAKSGTPTRRGRKHVYGTKTRITLACIPADRPVPCTSAVARGVEPPTHYDFKLLRDTPSELRGRFRKLGWRKVVAFQTRNPMHRAHQELTFRAAKEAEANLLIHPVVGMTKPGDIDHYTRVRCYEHVLEAVPGADDGAEPAEPRHAHGRAARGALARDHPQELRLHALHRRPRPRGPGQRTNGKPFYGPYDAQELLKQHEEEIDITMVPFRNMVYVEDKAEYVPDDEVAADRTVLNLSGTEFRRRLQEGLEIPEWFSYPKVVEELRRAHPPKHKQGFTVFFTGLSGSGKSTIANALMVKLLEMAGAR